jgi:hypothetical protein
MAEAAPAPAAFDAVIVNLYVVPALSPVTVLVYPVIPERVGSLVTEAGVQVAPEHILIS